MSVLAIQLTIQLLLLKVQVLQKQLALLQAQQAPVTQSPIQSIGSPDLSSVPTPPVDTSSVQSQTVTMPITETCTLQVAKPVASYDQRNGSFTWTYSGDPSVQGQIYVGNNFGTGGGNSEFQWTPIGNPVSGNGQAYIFNPSYFTLTHEQKFKLVIGTAECEFTFEP